MSAIMKPIGWVILVLVLVVLWFSLRTLHRNSSKATQPSASERSGASAYLELRNLALQHPPAAKIQSASVGKPGEPFAVLMDWGIESRTATVAA
jgi:hypothetical protein